MGYLTRVVKPVEKLAFHCEYANWIEDLKKGISAIHCESFTSIQTVYVIDPSRKTAIGMTTRGWAVIQSRMTCPLIGRSNAVHNFVRALSETGTTSPWIQLCAAVAERIPLKSTVVDLKVPAGTG